MSLIVLGLCGAGKRDSDLAATQLPKSSAGHASRSARTVIAARQRARAQYSHGGPSRSALHLNETAVLAEKKRLVVAALCAILRCWRVPAFFARMIVRLPWGSTPTAVVRRVLLRSAESATLYGRQLDRCIVRSLS